MAILGITSSTLISSLTTIKEQPLNKGDVYRAIMAFYLSQLHQTVMRSWENFAKTRKEIAQRGDRNHRAREIERKKQEGIRLEIERRSESFLLELTSRQASKFHYWEPSHHESGRHLHLSV